MQKRTREVEVEAEEVVETVVVVAENVTAALTTADDITETTTIADPQECRFVHENIFGIHYC